MKAASIETERHAVCDCGESWPSPNAMAVGSQHAEKYGHRVVVTVTKTATFDGRAQGEPELPYDG